MLCSVNSTPQDYSIIRFNVDIPWKCDYVKYYVSSINTNANIMVSTDDDYLLFEYIDNNKVEEVKIKFENRYSYTLTYLVNYMNGCQSVICFNNKNNRIISMTSEYNISFISGSHRAKLLTGLYNVKDCFECVPNEEIEMPDLPILNYANKLYLVSLQGQAVHSSIGEKEYTPSIIANIDTFILDQIPIIINYDSAKPIKIKTNTDSLKYLEMRLVDFMYQPVILKSPLFITLKIKPAKKADIYDVLTK